MSSVKRQKLSAALVAQNLTNSFQANIEEPELDTEHGCTIKLVEDPAFEMLIVGCGGGPLETNLSSYLLKNYSEKWSAGCTALEGGSGLGALAQLIERSPRSFEGWSIAEPGREGGGRIAGKVWESVRCFAITHAHLDHVQGLIISSGASLSAKPLYGTPNTITNIERIFDGGVWPKLAGWEKDGVTVGRAYLYRDIPAPTIDSDPLPLSETLNFHAFPLAHGMCPSKKDPNGLPKEESYDSTAFFITESITGDNEEMLFFGDVEPDSISGRPLNLAVWKYAAPKILAGKLSTIFIECSYPTSQPKDRLWGHLSPPYVFEELSVLSRLVQELDPTKTELPLQNLNIVIIHIKDDILALPFPPPRPQIPSPSPRLKTSALPETDLPPPLNLPARINEPQSPLTMAPPMPSLATLRRASGENHSGVVIGSRKSIANAGRRNIIAGGVVDRRASLPGYLGSGFQNSWIPPSPGFLNGSDSSKSKNIHGSISPKEKRSELISVEGKVESVELIINGPEEEDTFEGVGQQEEETVHERIERELNELEHIFRLGVKIIRAEQGMILAF